MLLSTFFFFVIPREQVLFSACGYKPGPPGIVSREDAAAAHDSRSPSWCSVGRVITMMKAKVTATMATTKPSPLPPRDFSAHPLVAVRPHSPGGRGPLREPCDVSFQHSGSGTGGAARETCSTGSCPKKEGRNAAMSRFGEQLIWAYTSRVV
jgi:hypothetical protein